MLHDPAIVLARGARVRAGAGASALATGGGSSGANKPREPDARADGARRPAGAMQCVSYVASHELVAAAMLAPHELDAARGAGADARRALEGARACAYHTVTVSSARATRDARRARETGAR